MANSSPKGYLVIVDIAVTIAAFFANAVAIDAASKSRFEMAGYRRFLISLIASDWFIAIVNFGVIFQPMFTVISQQCVADVLGILQLSGFIGK